MAERLEIVDIANENADWTVETEAFGDVRGYALNADAKPAPPPFRRTEASQVQPKPMLTLKGISCLAN